MSTRNFRSHREMRRNTYLKVISALRAGVNSKRGIQDHSGLSWGSCSPVINNLLSQGVIVNQQEKLNNQRPGKGRRTSYFHFNRKNFLLMGMELDTHRITSCVTTLGYERLGSYVTEFESPMSSGNITRHITRAFSECHEKLDLLPENMVCISFSIPGAVDVDRNIWQYCERVPGIKDFNFNKISSKSILPKYLYTQHNIHAQAYSVIPIAEIEEGDYVFIHVGQGMAMSANMGGILYGHRGFAGEIGHIPYPYTGETIDCLCGKKNCLEAILNTGKILNYLREKLNYQAGSLRDIEEKEILRKVAQDYLLDPLVYASTIVSNIFDPNRIIIEGVVLEPFYEYLKGEFESKLRQSAWLSGPTEICWYQSSDMDGAYGAVVHSSERIIYDFIDQIDLDH